LFVARIDFNALSRRGGAPGRLPCLAWERQPNTKLNRFFRAALEHVRRDPVFREAAGVELVRLLDRFEGIPSRVDHDLLDGRSTLERREADFRGAYQLARLSLRHSSRGEGESDPGNVEV
jgi:hypothetical protein